MEILHKDAIHIAVVGMRIGSTRFEAFFASQRDFILHCFESFDDLTRNSAPGVYFSGIVADTRALRKMNPPEKLILNSCYSSHMPFLETTLADDTIVDAIARRLFDRKWQAFVGVAKHFDPRGLRASVRQPRVLKVLICRDSENWEESKAEQAITADLSEGGCFIVSPGNWSPSLKVLVRLDNISAPIKARIAWVRPLGVTADKLPGFGIEFSDVPENTKADVRRLYHLGSLETNDP